MTNTAVPTLDIAAMRLKQGVNAHFHTWNQSMYRDGADHKADHPNPLVLPKIVSSRSSMMRERMNHSSGIQLEAMQYLGPRGIKIFGHVAQVSDNMTKAQVIAEVNGLAASSMAPYIIAFEGPNEINYKHHLNWPQKAVNLMGWTYDAVQAASWPGTTPLVIAASLKRFPEKDYDADIPLIAAARMSDGTNRKMDDVIDRGCIHLYTGTGGPGRLVSGNDTNHNRPPGLPSGQVTVQEYEIARIRVAFNNTTKTFWMTENGLPDGDKPSGMNQADWDTLRYTRATEVAVRNYVTGIDAWHHYEMVSDQYETGATDFGLWDPATGFTPAYQAHQDLYGHAGAESFTSVGHLVDIGGVVFDGWVAAASSGNGAFTLYALKNRRDNKFRLVLDPNYQLVGHSLSGGFYEVTFSDTIAILTVEPIADLPVWKQANPPDGNIGFAYSYTFVAQDATSYTAGANIPPGLTFNGTTGVLSGTPTGNGGRYVFKVTAHNSAGDVPSPTCVVNIFKGPTFVDEDPPDGTVNTAYSYTFTVTGYPNSTFSLGDGSLHIHTPDWLGV